MKIIEYRKFWLIVISLMLVSIPIQAQNGWTKKTTLPTLRIAAIVEIINGKIYVIGGNGGPPAYSSLTVNEMYDPVADKWEQKSPMVTPRGFFASGVVNDTIYVFGGGYSSPLNTGEAYDPVTNTWSRKADMINPRMYMRAAVIDGIIYIFGGNYNEHNVQAYDPATNKWTERTPIPPGGGGNLSVCAYVNGSIYIFGGSSNPTWSVPWQPLSTVYEYNTKTDMWTKRKDMPTARFGFQTFLVNGKIYAIGGSQARNTSLATVEVYDPDTDTWETKPDMPFSSFDPVGVVVDSVIYVISGSPDWATSDGSVWEYDPAFHTDILGGNVSGTWTLANSPYHILGETTIPNGETLTIEPGVEVVFMGHYKFNVQGRLLAVGTQQDSIRFTAENKEVGWHSIRFANTPNINDTSKFFYCSFKYGNANTGSGLDRCGGAMMISYFNKVLISDCLFDNNKQSGEGWNPPEADGGIYVYNASSKITNSTFSNNIGSKSSAIGCVFSPNSIISNNVFFNNHGKYGAIALCFNSGGELSGNLIYNNFATEAAGGILVDNGSKPMIINNVIVHNQGFCGGITCYISGKPVLIGNTIAHNTGTYGGGGIGCRYDGDPVLINNILFGNTAPAGKEIMLDDVESDPIILYCNVQGGMVGIEGAGAGSNYTGLYANNIDADPLFVNAASYNYGLSDSSPCIGAGIDSIQVAGIWYKTPSSCINGNPRPSPIGTMPDIGACESLLGTPVVGVNEYLPNIPNIFSLQQNHPNPFNPTTSIRYQLPENSKVSLKVYNTLGQLVISLADKVEEAGFKSIEWNASNVSSGVYFYRLEATSLSDPSKTFTQVKKMLLIR